MSNIRDLAVGSVLTAPSPASSGTTLVLSAGQGADMPTTVPFKLLVFPPGAIPSKANSEKVLVTARSTDTLTITRAQGETTAKNIAAGWLVANAVFTEDIFNSSLVNNEVPSGTVNGSNTAFTLASAPSTGSVRLFLNGVRLKITDDYTISGSTITFVTAPPTGSNILADYAVGTMANSVGTNSFVMKETPTGSVNSSNATFTTLRAYIAGSLQVYVNGLMQGPTHVTETTPASGIFTLDVAPTTGDIVHVSYQFNLNSSSNADTVDGKHAAELAPIGDIAMTLNVAPQTNRLFMDGSTYNKADYPLFATHIITNTAYVSATTSTTFTLKDMRQRFPLGKAALGTGNVLGGTGGTELHAHGSGTYQTQSEFFTTGGRLYMDWVQATGGGAYTANRRDSVSGSATTEANSEVSDLGMKVGGVSGDASSMPPFIAVNFEVRVA